MQDTPNTDAPRASRRERLEAHKERVHARRVELQEQLAERKAAFADAEAPVSIEAQVATAVNQGWRVESLTTTQAVLVKGKRPNHLLHLLLTVFTAGLWLPGWIVVAVASGEKRRVITVSA